MPSEEEEPKPNEIVSWEFTRKLAEDMDRIALERVFSPRGANVRRESLDYDNEWVSYNPGAGDSYDYKQVCDLTADISTPFPLKLPMVPGIIKNEGDEKHTLWQRFEFAYYNYGPNGEYMYEPSGKRDGFSESEKERAPEDLYKWQEPYKSARYTKRYYYDNTRQPVMYSSFITDETHRAIRPSELLDPDNTDERVTAMGDTYMSRFMVNLMESHRHLLFKTIPGVSAYSSVPTIASELYFLTEDNLPFNCKAITRLCICLSEDDRCHNGNGNGKAYPCLQHGTGGVRGRPYQACGRIYAMNGLASVTLASREWLYAPEAYTYKGDPDTELCHDADLYPNPPICSGCQDVKFPCIGLEAGVRAWSDGSNFGLPSSVGGYDTQLSYNSLGNRPCDLYDETIFHPGFSGAVTKPYTMVVDWDPSKARRPQKTRGSGTKRLNRKQRQQHRLQYRYCKEGYRKYWCHPEDVEWYETVSKYEVWNIGNRGAMVRVTPILFRDEITLRDGSKAVRRYKFVWVPTAVSFQIGGKLTTPIRKRWYDMLIERARYVSGYWPHNYTIREAINFDKVKADKTIADNAATILHDIEFRDFDLQQWNGFDDERDIHRGEGMPVIEQITETPCADQSTGKPDLRAFTHQILEVSGVWKNIPMPLGVTWDYTCETKWNPMDMQCARWLAEGPKTGSAIVGWTSDVPDVNLSCGAYFGTRYWDSLVATLNEVGNRIEDGADYRLMELDTDGGICDMPVTDSCGEDTPAIYDPTMPWWGGCGNTICNPRYNALGQLTRRQTYNVHAFTLVMLRRLVNFIDAHKHIENPAGWIATDDWKACSPDTYSLPIHADWSGPWYYTMDYTVPVYTIPPHTPTPTPAPTPTPTPVPYPTYTPYPTAVPCDRPYAILTNLGLPSGVGYWCWIEDAGGAVLATSYGTYELRGGGSPYELQMMINDLSTGPVYMYDLVEVENPMQASTRLIKASHATQDLYNAKLKVFRGPAISKITVAEIVLSECDTPAYAPSRLAAPKAATLQFDGSVADVLSSSIGILSASSIKSNDLANGCEWHEEDYGEWKYYWCNAYGGQYRGQLPYERFRLSVGCYADEECGWAGKVDVILPPEDSGLAGVRSHEQPEPGNAGDPWWSENVQDNIVVKVACSSEDPMTSGMVWCPYLIGHEGTYEITIKVSSPMKRGPRKADQNAVRGYIEGMCGPSGFGTCEARAEGETGSLCAAEPEKYAATGDAPTDGPCPRLTDINAGGGSMVTVWKAGWEPNASIIGYCGFHGEGTCEGYTYDIWEYLQEADRQEWTLTTEVTVANDQQRGYLGLTFTQGAFAAHGNRLSHHEFEDSIEKYVYCPHDEYYLVQVSIKRLEEEQDEPGEIE